MTMKVVERPAVYCGACGDAVHYPGYQHVENRMPLGYWVVQCLRSTCSQFHTYHRLPMVVKKLEPNGVVSST